MYITTGRLPRVDDPPWSDIESTLRVLPYVTRDAFIVCTSQDEPLNYMQAYPEAEAAFLIEFRDGEARRHYSRNDVELEEAVALFKNYYEQGSAWRIAGLWQDISDQFDDLK